MTLDEIIAGMKHNARCLTRSFSTAQTGNASECWCAKCQLIAFRAEMEAMVRRWNRREGWKFFGHKEEGPLTLNCCANELRAKIGEGK